MKLSSAWRTTVICQHISRSWILIYKMLFHFTRIIFQRRGNRLRNKTFKYQCLKLPQYSIFSSIAILALIILVRFVFCVRIIAWELIFRLHYLFNHCLLSRVKVWMKLSRETSTSWKQSHFVPNRFLHAVLTVVNTDLSA